MQEWQKNDYISRDEMTSIQLEKLNLYLKHIYRNSKFYKDFFHDSGLNPDSFTSLEDLKKLPFTTKADLRDAYPYSMAAVRMKKIMRIHASSGTTGKPVVMGYTSGDVSQWSRMMARLCAIAGVSANDIAQISFGYGLFTGGFGLHYGLEKLGATVVPFSSGNTERQLALMKDFKTTVLVSTPSFAIYMAESAMEKNIDPASFSLRVGLFGGEPCSELMRQEIEKHFKIKATVNYGLTEVVGPGVSGECEHCSGMHIMEDYIIPEIIDPETKEQLADGETGELVLTPVFKRGFPVIRYRTGDITRLIPGRCSCGRVLKRMDYITGRTDDMLIIKGVNIFPSQIEEVLATFREVSPHYRLVVHSEKGFNQDIEVHVELTQEGFSDSFKEMESLENRIRQALRSSLSLGPRIKLMNPKSIERSTGKSKRIFSAEGDE